MTAIAGVAAFLLVYALAIALWKLILIKYVPASLASTLAKPAQAVLLIAAAGACTATVDYLGPGEGPARIYVDNAFSDTYDISIDGETLDSVQPRSCTIVELEGGEHAITILLSGDTIETSTIAPRAGLEYIYNIGRGYTYYIETHVYGDELFPDIPPAKAVGNELFFRMPDVDFGLDETVPHTIEVEEWRSTRRQERTSLYRVAETAP